MKKLILFFVVYLLQLSVATFSQQWQYLGNPGFSQYSTSGISASTDKDGVTYVATKMNSEIGFSVLKFESGQWTTIGANSSINNLFTNGVCKIIFDKYGINPYVIGNFQFDGNTTKTLAVLRYDGRNWIIVGGLNQLSNKRALYFDIAFAPNNTPFVVYLDDYNNGVESIKTKKLLNDEWVMAADSIVEENVGNLSFCMKDTSNFMACYISKSATDAIFTKAIYNGGKWNKSYGETYTNYSKCAVSEDGTYYYAWSNTGSTNKSVSVFQLKNGVVTDISNGITTGDIPLYLNLKVSANGTPYIAFKDGLNALIKVYAYVNTQWRELPNTSSYCYNALSLSIDMTNKIVTGYTDNNDYYWNKLSAKSINYHENPLNINTIKVNNQDIVITKTYQSINIRVNSNVKIKRINIFNTTGVKLLSQTTSTAESTVTIASKDFAKGAYIVQLITENDTKTLKIAL